MLKTLHRKKKTPELYDKEGNSKNWQVYVSVAAMFLGILMTLLFKGQAKAGFPMFNQRSEMIKMVHELELQRDKLQADLAEKNKAIEDFEKSAGSRADILRTMQNQLNELRVEAGYTNVTGEGIIVELADSPKKPSPKDDPFYFIVHDVDIATLVNELWASGAEAISVNDQRIVATTSIRCVGPTVLVNSVRMASPYKVRAIGPSKDLQNALKTPGGFMDYMLTSVTHGVKVQIITAPVLEIPSYKGSMTPRYAKEIGKKGEEEK